MPYAYGNYIHVNTCLHTNPSDWITSYACLVGGTYLVPFVNFQFDFIIIGGYSSPTAILAMVWLRLHRIPFYMEVDGGLIRQEGKLKYFVKKTLVCLASRWLST